MAECRKRLGQVANSVAKSQNQTREMVGVPAQICREATHLTQAIQSIKSPSRDREVSKFPGSQRGMEIRWPIRQLVTEMLFTTIEA